MSECVRERVTANGMVWHGTTSRTDETDGQGRDGQRRDAGYVLFGKYIASIAESTSWFTSMRGK